MIGAGKGAPIVHELDTTDLDKWDEVIFDKAVKIFQNYLTGNVISLPETTSKEDSIFEYNKCETCDLIFVEKNQWECEAFLLTDSDLLRVNSNVYV